MREQRGHGHGCCRDGVKRERSATLEENGRAKKKKKGWVVKEAMRRRVVSKARDVDCNVND